MPDYTREQLLAQSADRHLAVTAGAGAGKTSVLVERFVHLLLDSRIQADVRSITAITFTRKAAAEMKSRVSARLEQLLSDPARQSDWRRIKSIRERFASANISTIHSFCSALLRDFPIEAGVNPNFTDLEEYEANALKERAIIETLEEWLEPPRLRGGGDNNDKNKSDNDDRNAKLNAAFDDEQDSRRAEAQHVWMFFGKRDLINVLATLLDSSERFQELQRLYAQCDNDAILALARRRFVARFSSLLREWLTALESALGLLIVQECTPNAQEHLNTTLTGIRSLQNLLNEAQNGAGETFSWQDLERLWQHDIQEKMLGQGAIAQSGGVNGNRIRVYKKNCQNLAQYNREKARAERRFKELAEYAATISGAKHDDELGRIARILVRIAADAFDHIEAEKKRLDALDFDDLQLKTDILLDNPLVCEQIRRKMRFLMIDEFQDTNKLQYRIVKKLIGSLGRNPETLPAEQESVSASGVNLFIVGDPKQSIYRFRGADVRVFAEAKADIQEANRRRRARGEIGENFHTPKGEIQSRDGEAEGDVNLSATFRLLPEIAAFVNGVLGRLMRPKRESAYDNSEYDISEYDISEYDIPEYDISEYDVEYDKIVCGGATAEVKGTVRFLVAQSPSKDDDETGAELGEEATTDDEEAPQKENEEKATKEEENEGEEHEEESAESPFTSEAFLLAEYLKAAVRGELAEPLLVRDGEGKPRAPKYGDILILARSRAKLDTLLQALRGEGIPFTVSGGRGYFEKQEILDIRSFLSFLQNSSDDAALAATLRSPFFCVSDSELYAASRLDASALSSDGVNSLWERFCEYVAGAGGQSSDAEAVAPSDNALRAVATLRRLLSVAAQIPIPALLRLIIEETGWRAMLVGSERFEQIEANIEKLLTIARYYENKGFRNLFDFAEELRRLSLYADKEGEADTQSSKDAVRIMTIHAAKGLESPIVALYNANGRSGGQTERLAFDAELGAAFMMKSAREEDGIMESVKTPLYALASREDDLAEQAEAKRLLYVALTRAKDHLLISAECRKTSTESAVTQGFFKMILGSLGAANKNVFVETQIACPPQELEILASNDKPQETVTYNLCVPVIRTRAQFLGDEALRRRFPSHANAKTNAKASVAKSLAPSLEAEYAAPPTSSVARELPPLLLGSAQARIEGEYFSASQLQLFLADPEAYAHLYRLGLPPVDEEGAFSGGSFGVDDDGDRTLGTFAGESIHAVLERLPNWLSESGEIREEAYKQALARAVPQNASARSLSSSFVARLQREPHSVASSPLLRRYAPALARAKYEFPLTIPFGENFLIAALDALVPAPPLMSAQGGGRNNQEREEIWEVWDWKTNRVRTEHDMNALVERYRLQMEVYAFMVSSLYPAQERVRVRLLFTRLASQNSPDERWTRTLDFGRDDIAVIRGRIQNIIAQMQAAYLGESVVF
jgi:ATP-dependent helicase/nuclease subunit A